MGERLEDWKAAANLVRKIAENYKLPYYTLSPTYSVCKNHGYITGEVYKCPECGAETEVYSRITGYYRPIKNWNDGKTKEYEMRKEYDMCKALKATKKKAVKTNSKSKSKSEEKCEDGIMLFGTKTCPNCASAKKLLDKYKVKYSFVDAEENADMTKKFGVKQAPTLVVISKGKAELIPNLSNIKKYAESFKK